MHFEEKQNTKNTLYTAAKYGLIMSQNREREISNLMEGEIVSNCSFGKLKEKKKTL